MSMFKVVPSFDGLHSFTVLAPDDSPVADVNAYLEHLATCGRSPYTLRAYAQGLADFIAWLHQHQLPLITVSSQHIARYIGEFARSPKRGACPPDPQRADHVHPQTRKPYPGLQRKNSTINHRLSVLSGLFEFCIKRDTRQGQGSWQNRINPVTSSVTPTAAHGMTGRDQPPRRRTSEFRRRKTHHFPKHLAPHLAEQLIEQARSWRDKAILTLLFRTGQRIGDWSEFAGCHGILGMTTADVDAIAGTITVRLKGARDEHRVPVTDDFWPIYRRYLEDERPSESDSPALWLVTRREQERPLSYATFESALRYLNRKLELNVNAHMFRHTLAQGILETTGNLKVAQEILGHAHLSTTADQYAYVDEAALVETLTSVKQAFTRAAQDTLEAAHPTTHGQAGSLPPSYAFPYDPRTIEELDQACMMQEAVKAGGPIL
jgi:integrase/recombinase XerD